MLNVAEDHLDWYAGPSAMADYAADKGRIYTGVRARLRLQRRRPGHRAAGPRRRRRGGRPGDRLHPRHPGRRHARRGRRRAGRPGLRRGPPDHAPPSCARSPTWPARRRTSSPTRWPPPRSPARTASRPARSSRRCARSVPTGTGSPRSPSSTASPGSTTPRPPTRTRRWPRCGPTTRWCGSPGGWPRAPRFDDLVVATRDRLRGVVLLGRDAPVIREALARHAPDVPVIEVADGETDGEGPMDRVVAGAAALAQPATPCCWPRAARPWTCSPTTAHAATPSRRPCAGGGGPSRTDRWARARRTG